MPKAIKRYFIHYGNGRRMEQFTNLRPNECCSNNHLAFLIHNDFRLANIAIGMQPCSIQSAHFAIGGADIIRTFQILGNQFSISN
jgi:hypothetical protein